ncbi:chaperone modulator CbpM [Komagataeibacter sp. FNDCF1]|uniref:chaperone modulator CbpM n=1 Tax=Komagataeibacter sp. FNDCF1 TaxID=2878681 RepID=UPI001E314BCC|nr:chaperone modulator CbpM [Komagataeibacter sp. FNDCF1]MCE2564972.1 chaperone modulator CbpM [Komagataeibacter sp. FNDCF1]
MITLETLCIRIGNVPVEDVQGWIDSEWLRPEGTRGHYLFREIDEARARLIRELREDMGVNDEGVPVVLSLLDQLYAARRQMYRLREAISAPRESELRGRIRALLASLDD